MALVRGGMINRHAWCIGSYVHGTATPEHFYLIEEGSLKFKLWAQS